MMNDWTSGYVADIGYTFGYYHELNPLRARLALLYNGVVCPEFGTACELGFGQGLSTNLHAAASDTHWQGTDFNPSQAGFAQQLAKESGVDAGLYDEAFSDFCNRQDLPDFDFIGLHGIWSWINDSNRDVIVDFIRRKLKVGGVLYISYNTYPGWAAFAPMRQLMVQHAEVIGSEGRGIVSRIDGAMEFAEQLLATDPIYSKANPLVGERLQAMQKHNRHYLAHEYFNRDWHPMYFSTMAKWLSNAKMDFACSAAYLDFIDPVNLTEEQQKFLNDIPDTMLRQSTRDFMVNTQFRKDYWVKGVRRLSSSEQSKAILNEKVILQSYRPEVPLKVTSPRGEADMAEAIYNPVLDVLADNQPHSIRELAEKLASENLSMAQISQAVMVLANSGQVAPAQSAEAQQSVAPRVKALNDFLLEKARDSNDIETLASPVTGGGVSISRFPQLFISAYNQGIKQPDQLALFVWQILKSQSQKIIKEGKMLESDQENIAELESQASDFLTKQLQVIKGLGIIQ